MEHIRGPEPLNIVHVVHSLNAGGMENGIVNMATVLAERGIYAHVCCLTNSGSFAQRLPTSSRVIELQKPAHVSLLTAIRLRRSFSVMNAQIVHSHNWSGLFYALLADPFGRNLLIQGEHAQLTGWEKEPKRISWRRRFYQRCDVVHTVSEGQKKELVLLGVGAETQIEVLKNGVDSSRFHASDQEAARASLSMPKDGFYIGMVARCIADKRHDRLLAAFAKVAATFPEAHLVLAGDGGDVCEQVRATVHSHPHKERIHWLGHFEQMPLVYQTLDLLIITSETEGLSNACLEAMSSGVPVLTNDSCGAAEVVVDGITGSVVPLRSSEDIEKHLTEALRNPARWKQMQTAARHRVVEHFSLSAMADRYENLYRRLYKKSALNKP
jgi:L-malate glycosyltransferase